MSRLHKPYYRNGDNHRAGADVSFNDVRKVFGFRSIEIGRWVTKEEQQLAANLFFDALCDLADMLQVPTPVISLNGNLSLAFGQGGNKYASAHYNASIRQLALAKNAGGGALAHEWFHAFDHYIASKAFVKPKRLAFASTLWLAEARAQEHPLNERLFNIFESMFLADDLVSISPLMVRSVNIDKAMGGYYFAQPPEVAARAFEAVLQNHDIKNQFLVAGTKQSNEAKLGAYPDLAEQQSLTERLRDYFSLLGRAVSAQQA